LDTNPEIVAAREKGMPVVPRAQILNDLMQLKQGIAVAGTHGKTTTTSMLAWILAQAGLDPTLVIGGVLNNINRGARLGKGAYFIVEACEAYSSFLHLTPTAVVITNIDDDHLENYGSRAALDDAFVDFINRVPFWGTAVLNLDDPGVRAVLPRLMKRKVTYGFTPEAELRAEAEVVSDHKQYFMAARKRRLGRIEIQLPGRFNILNALAATGMALELGVPFATIQKALASFSGVRRRFERKGQYQQAWLFDDYAHHPTEVAATLEAARTLKPGRVVVVFQPHLFSRTQRLYREFARALLQADVVFLADIYPARERPVPGVSSQLIADQLSLEGRPLTAGPAPLARLLPKIKRELRAGDIFITMGAGDVHRLGEQLAAAGKTAGGKKLKKEKAKRKK
ncbi:UDP-N-acetylmuramate--L-alanine ligase, partial [candidate division FCPU426 bacterium]|nr:UDP-N-acetylmuramate--L-alanine ligase [candidate division FCPU426 bacterium]